MIALAFAALIWGFISHSSRHGNAEGGQSVDYALPAGSKILQILPTTSARIVMAVQMPGGSSDVYIFDTDDGQLVSHIHPAR